MPGIPYYQRQLGAEVRDLTLKEIKKILLDLEHKTYTENFRGQVILRLAGNVLPRIQEISGQDGKPIKIIFDETLNPARQPKENNSLSSTL
jgi:hypothetical protein